ncbi:MAG: type II toxin-antitoxin system HicA family toxin [Verrucomicrobiota bacterium]
MKPRDLIRKLEKQGCQLLHHGFKPDIYHNPETRRTQPVPRHNEINGFLARKIIRDLSRI